ncbi:MAG: SH3 domain-containing protein [Butyrivibrio sp.]|nr:SH3 domain-containing protein [Butyrivibrio sp.]
MADKILNINDYRKRTPDEIADDIEIQDPYDFLNADEREEYIKNRAIERQKEAQAIIDAASKSLEEMTFQQDDGTDHANVSKKEEEKLLKEREREIEEKERLLAKREQEIAEKERQAKKEASITREEKLQKEAELRKQKEEASREKERLLKEKLHISENRSVADEDFDEDEEYEKQKKSEKSKSKKKEEPGKKIKEKKTSSKKDKKVEKDFYEDDEEDYKIEKYIRIASFITGLIILVLIVLIAKKKIIDPIFATDPDEQVTTQVGEIAGFVEASGTVVTNTKSNLRTIPSTDNDSFIAVTVDSGMELTRTGISEDGEWTKVEYNGETLYIATRLITEK